MSFEIKVPAVGESITEATIGEWQKQTGDFVERDDVLLVLETDKASVEVVAETAGTLTTKAEEGDTVEIGAIVGTIEEGEGGNKAAAPAEASSSNGAADTPPPLDAAGQSQQAHPDLKGHLSPATRRVVEENQLDPSKIEGTGRGGRLTKEDAMKATSGGATSTPATQEAKSAPAPQAPPLPTPKGVVENTETREKMTTIRKKIAERLVSAQHEAAILTTFNEIDMSNAMALRAKYKDSFKEKYGISLGFMGLFVKAAIEALKMYPRVNAFIDGEEVVYHNYQNVGNCRINPQRLDGSCDQKCREPFCGGN